MPQNDRAYKQLLYARQFEKAAKKVIECDPPRQRLELLPTLHLIAHGFELTLKAALTKKGISTGKQKKTLGHDLAVMWEMDELSDLRDVARLFAEDCCREAKEAGILEGPFPEKPYDDFVEHFKYLSELHSRDSDYLLRYPNSNDTIDVLLPDELRCILDKLIHHVEQQRVRD